MYVIEKRDLTFPNSLWVLMTDQYYSEKWLAEAVITVIKNLRKYPTVMDWEFRITELTELTPPDPRDTIKGFSITAKETNYEL